MVARRPNICGYLVYCLPPDHRIVVTTRGLNEVGIPELWDGVIPDESATQVCDDPNSVNANRTVLIVDDHDGFRMSARRMLEREGFQVVGEAVDGVSGVAQAEQLKPDIALVDVRLPDIDGFEVASAIRAAESGRVRSCSYRPARAGDLGDRLAQSDADEFIEKAELSGTSIAAIIDGPR